MPVRPRPALDRRDPLILHLVLANVHQAPRLVRAVRAIRHRQAAVPLGLHPLRGRARRLRRHRVTHAHLAVLRRRRRRRRGLRTIRERLLEDRTRDHGGPGAAVAVQVGGAVAQRRAAETRLLLVLRRLRGRLVLGLALLPDVLVGGEAQERDVDVEEAEVQQQAGGDGGEDAEGGHHGEEGGVAGGQRRAVRGRGGVLRREEALQCSN